MSADRGKAVFLGGVAIVAGAFAFLIYTLPPAWRDAAIMWTLLGLPSLYFVLRVYRGYVQIRLEDMARTPPPPLVATMPGVGKGGDRGELRVVETAGEGKHGRRLL